MAEILVGIGGIGASKAPEDSIVTMALGSCVAIVVHDPRSGVTGMAHVALPGSPREQNRSQPVGYYADTAVPALIEAVEKKGGPLRGRGLTIKLIGGASILDTVGTFNIGKRNVLAIKRALWRYGLGPIAEDVGGNISRTVRLKVGRPDATITTPGKAPWRI
jgi:chemotaxis protein CheD